MTSTMTGTSAKYGRQRQADPQGPAETERLQDPQDLHGHRQRQHTEQFPASVGEAPDRGDHVDREALQSRHGNPSRDRASHVREAFAEHHPECQRAGRERERQRADRPPAWRPDCRLPVNPAVAMTTIDSTPSRRSISTEPAAWPPRTPWRARLYARYTSPPTLGRKVPTNELTKKILSTTPSGGRWCVSTAHNRIHQRYAISTRSTITSAHATPSHDRSAPAAARSTPEGPDFQSTNDVSPSATAMRSRRVSLKRDGHCTAVVS